MAYGLNPGMIDEETPEERRMRLLAEMNPFTPRPGMGEQGTIGSSGSAFGFMPQGMMGSDMSNAPGPAWRDPGSDGPATAYQDPPTRGILDTKIGEPPKSELDGILFGGTRSAPGMDALAAAKSRDSMQSGPDMSLPGLNVTGANGSDRSNVPRAPDAPANAPSMVANPFGAPTAGAPSSFPTPPRATAPAKQPRAIVEGGVPATSPPPIAPGAPAAGQAASPRAAGAAGLAQPQIAAVADGLSRTPGSPDAMNWLKENADLFIGLGAGLLSGKNIGEGILHGLKMANESKVASAKEKELLKKNQTEQLQTATFAAMVKKAYPQVSAEEAISIAQTPAMMNEVFKSQFPSEQWQQQGGGDTSQGGFLKNVRTGDIKADPSRPAPPDKVETLTPDQAAAIPGLDPKVTWQRDAAGRITPVQKSGQTINVNTGEDKLVAQAADRFKMFLGEGDAARQTLQATQAMRDQLNAPGGIISGAGAGDRLALQKVGALLGVANTDQITNTESFKAAAGPLVLATVKGLGSGSGITNSDRDFAEAMAGGRVNLDESSIRRMIDIQEKAARSKLETSQRVVNDLIQTNPNLAQMAPLFNQSAPPPQPPAASQSAPPAAPAPAPAAPAQRRIRVDAQGNILR
jgi:hypothetical protein